MPLDRMIQIELATPRFRLRRLRPKDAALLTLYASDAKVARMTTRIPHPYPPGLADTFINRTLSSAARELVWAIDSGEDDENGLVGLVSLRPGEDHDAEISYWVASAFWGTGYASQSVRAICEAAADWDLETIRARVFQDNAASIRVLMRAGFGFLGQGEIFCVSRGCMVPTFTYSRRTGAL
jgi:RimJ/RimL family protein N-acetyltransferase